MAIRGSTGLDAPLSNRRATGLLSDTEVKIKFILCYRRSDLSHRRRSLPRLFPPVGISLARTHGTCHTTHNGHTMLHTTDTCIRSYSHAFAPTHIHSIYSKKHTRHPRLIQHPITLARLDVQQLVLERTIISVTTPNHASTSASVTPALSHRDPDASLPVAQ